MRYVSQRLLMLITICCCLTACKKEAKNTIVKNPVVTGPYTYLELNKSLLLSSSYAGTGLDINNDGNIEFSIFNNEIVASDGSVSYSKYIQPLNPGGIVQIKDSLVTIAAAGVQATCIKLFNENDIIDTLNTTNYNFSAGPTYFDYEGPVIHPAGTTYWYTYGEFGTTIGYFGFRIKDATQRWHYGWGSVTITGNNAVTGNMVLNEICYKNDPDELIKAGEH